MMSDKRTLLFVILFLALVHEVFPKRSLKKRIGSRRGSPTRPRSCRQSSDCVSSNLEGVSCCTDGNTGLVIDPDLGRFDEPLGPSPQGVCTQIRSLRDQYCNPTCGCVGDLVCYRRQTGFCCAPSTCLTQAEVDEDRNRPPPP